MSDAPKKSWFTRLKEGLAKTSRPLTQGIKDLFTKKKLDQASIEELEDLLIQADLGVKTSHKIVSLIAKSRFDKDVDEEEVRVALAQEIAIILDPIAKPLVIDNTQKPHVILVVGVNGTGKTTTIAKLTKEFKEAGHSIMLGAADTFRAAAIEQLQIWGDRLKIPVITKQAGADPAAVAFEAYEKARKDNIDILMIDTAGRLQNKTHLMAELEKIIRTLKKIDPSAPHSVLLILDATTGQNAYNQVEIFQQLTGVTGLIMTKLDGTAKGGIIVGLAEKFNLPIHAIGVGETSEDLKPFKAKDFANHLMGIGD
ncbi:MAG: signal recognition particle-docking protein FtsY [Alphaproteobacteria bacterium]|nr:signal recognition particle-docking protein FtsY [Alphaproteobacteria bacterium]